MLNSIKDHYLSIVKNINFLKKSYKSFLEYYDPIKDPNYIFLNKLKLHFRFYILIPIIHSKYKDRNNDKIEISGGKNENILTEIFLIGEFILFIMSNLLFIYNYLLYLKQYDKTKYLINVKRIFSSKDWFLITENTSNDNRRNDMSKIVSVFVKDEEVILVHKNSKCPELIKYINPAHHKHYYSSIIADSKPLIKNDPISNYLKNEQLDSFADIKIISMIYSYVNMYTLSDNKSNIDSVTVSYNSDGLNQLHSAIILGLFLDKMRFKNGSPILSRDYLNYKHILSCFHSLKGYNDEIKDFGLVMEDVLDEELMGDVQTLRNSINSTLGNMIFDRSIREDILKLLTGSRNFYLDGGSRLDTDSKDKKDIAHILGQLDAIFGYLGTLQTYPLDAHGILELRDSYKREISNHGDMILLALESRDFELGGLKNDQIRIFYLNKNLNICKLRSYYKNTSLSNSNEADILIPTNNPYHTINTEDALGYAKDRTRFQVCESNSISTTEYDSIVSHGLTQYSGYALIKILCGNEIDTVSGAGLMTLQGDICGQKANFNRWGAQGFCRNISEPGTNAFVGNLNINILTQEDRYLSSIMYLSEHKYKFFSFFISRINIKDCGDILNNCRYPSYVHIFRGFYWANYIFRRHETLPTNREIEVYDAMSEKLKFIFKRVNGYTFSNSYKDLYRQDLMHGQDSLKNKLDMLVSRMKSTVGHVNRTNYNSSNNFGDLLRTRKEKIIGDKLLSSIEGNEIRSSEVKNFLVKSLTYACFMYNLTAHLSYLIGLRIENNDNIPSAEGNFKFLTDLGTDDEDVLNRFPYPYINVPERIEDSSDRISESKIGDQSNSDIPGINSVLELKFDGAINGLNNFLCESEPLSKNTKITIHRLPAADSTESGYHTEICTDST